MTFLDDQYHHAIASVATWLADENTGARELSEHELSVFEGYAAGWMFPFTTEHTSHLQLLVDREFPYSMPRVFIGGTDEALSWPHVESGGRLCLAGDGAAIATDNPVAVIRHVLNEAHSLIEDNAAGLNTEDYLDDFKAYWRRSLEPNAPQLRFHLTHKDSRLVSAWHGKAYCLVAENSHAVHSWMENLTSKTDTRTTYKAAVISLDSLPLPSHYPCSCRDLRNLVRDHSRDGLNVLDQLLSDEPSVAAVLLLGKASIGADVHFGAIIRKPAREQHGHRQGAFPYAKGFRSGKVPATVLAQHYKLERSSTVNVDAWKSRIGTSTSTSLEHKKVTIIGCGSLGSSVAQLLAKSGLGRLHLIDSENLGWENIARHELGAGSVNRNKAFSLAQQIKAHMPQIRECSQAGRRWLEDYTLDNDLFSDSDLVISTTGDWNSDSALSDLCQAGKVACPVLFGWMEAYACASHAMAVHEHRGCFRCGFDDVGKQVIPATLWSSDPTPDGCGGGTSVYGAIELSQAAAMVAQLAIEVLVAESCPPVWRTWLAPKQQVYSNGGLWNPEWTKRFGHPESGAYLTANFLPRKTGCTCSAD
ncbi:ThiF family adenylyltransferase [Halioglobus pacificus]|uniref:ThiF family adenylyltransferase n=1 Tax=Parahalioglobus pacificus TaxID=930806 RepID=UPI00167542FA|nr:ThiF family adenylyltransferase [Halioglobus pacificus]